MVLFCPAALFASTYPDTPSIMTGACNATIALRLTPASPGAIGVIAIEGPSAAPWILKHFRTPTGKSIEHWPLQTPRFGHWLLGNLHSEEVIVVRQNPDRFELQCHAGLVVQTILTQLEKLGAELTPIVSKEHQWPPQSLEDQATDSLIYATTTTAAAILLEQKRGALRTAIETILQHVLNHELQYAQTKIEELLQASSLGLHLTKPWQVQLAGPPNVGKSSLLNRILGYQRAIVHDSAGTTRDLVEADTSINGWPFRFVDSAGIRENLDLAEAESIGIERALTAAQHMDVILLITEPTHGITATHQRFLDQFPHTTLLILNQTDRISDEQSQTLCNQHGALGVSAHTGKGIDSLLNALTQRLIPKHPAPHSPVPFRTEHVQHLHGALEGLRIEDLTKAKTLLHELLTPATS